MSKVRSKRIIHPVAIAIISATLFGLSTPLRKIFLEYTDPQMIAALLYLGSGLGLFITKITRAGMNRNDGKLTRHDLPWLLAAIICGGVLAPVALLFGLQQTSAASASLLLNLEGVFTAIFAWFIFKENVDRRIALGMVLIITSGLLLCWQPGANIGLVFRSLFIVLACLLWAVDNNLTRKVSAADPVTIACIKGWIAGSVNFIFAFGNGSILPSINSIILILGIGFISYGLSLWFFILALRNLGTARTSAYFSTAPFIGTSVSLLIFGMTINTFFWIACILAAIGVWLHITEKHEHEHTHELLEHEHSHIHDEHHQHRHDDSESQNEPHSHWHKHDELSHTHPHYPDIHHRHSH